MELTSDNYFSGEANKNFMSYSQFKDFLECEAKGLAKAEGRYVQETTAAMLQGSYVDAYFSGEFEKFKEENPDIFNKNGTLSAKYELCNRIIERIKSDRGFYDSFYLGDSQVLIEGEIAEVPFKGKIDFLHSDKIVDMKCMKSPDKIEPHPENGTFALLNWSDEKHRYVPFWQTFRYDIQAAVYQELVRQKTGKLLPYYLAVATKEDPSKHFCFRFDQSVLDRALALVKEKAPRFQQIKEHKIEPIECGLCDYYWKTHEFDMTFDTQVIISED